MERNHRQLTLSHWIKMLSQQPKSWIDTAINKAFDPWNWSWSVRSPIDKVRIIQLIVNLCLLFLWYLLFLFHMLIDSLLLEVLWISLQYILYSLVWLPSNESKLIVVFRQFNQSWVTLLVLHTSFQRIIILEAFYSICAQLYIYLIKFMNVVYFTN